MTDETVTSDIDFAGQVGLEKYDECSNRFCSYEPMKPEVLSVIGGLGC